MIASATAAPAGMPKEALGTPALLVDLDAMDANIACIHAACRAHGVQWRPHVKGQKVPELAQRPNPAVAGLLEQLGRAALEVAVEGVERLLGLVGAQQQATERDRSGTGCTALGIGADQSIVALDRRGALASSERLLGGREQLVGAGRWLGG